MLTQVKLYGHLARKFGKLHAFDVKSPKEAIKALQANFPGFCAHLAQYSLPGYHIVVGKTALDVEELPLNMTNGRTIKIIPAVVGGKSPWVTIIIGVALIIASQGAAAGWYTSTFAANAAIAGSMASMVVGAAFGMGVALVLGGVSTLLAGTPQLEGPASSTENKPSYTYDGAVNTTSQGYPVPVCYGMMEVGSAVASVGVYAEEYMETASGEPTSGFRITAPLLHNTISLAVGDPIPTSFTSPVTFAGTSGTATATIASQLGGGAFALTGTPGSQVLSASGLGFGTYTIVLNGSDGVETTTKTISVYVVDAESGSGGGPGGPGGGDPILLSIT